ncbi:MAG: type IV secretion system protein [Rickettsiales bacterium]|nr:type IV secretion system protein [Rickettsiales bacterium]
MLKGLKITIILFFIIFANFSNVEIANSLPFGNDGRVKGEAIGCNFYPGFVNKIVQCITNQTTYGLVTNALNRMHSFFVATGNSLVVIYIMSFAMKLSLQGVKELKKEVAIVALTAVGVITLNSTTSITKFMNFFIKGQEEFVNVTTTAMSTRRANETERGIRSSDFLCYQSQAGQKYNIWQRIDCVIGYILGVHPLVKYTEKHVSCDKKFDPTMGVDLTDPDLSSDEQKLNLTARPKIGCYDYSLFAGDKNPFADMASDPFSFMQDTGKVTDKFEVGVSFSFIVMIVLMLFSEDFGIILMVTGLFIVIILIMAFGQAVLIYVTSLFTILVLGLFAPIVIPLFLFKTTNQIFTSWLQMFFSAMLTPGLMFAYLSFMILTLQYVLNYETTVNGEQVSIMTYHFGDKYINAKKDYKDAMTVTKNLSSEEQLNADNWRKVIEETIRTRVEIRDRDKNVETDMLRDESQFTKDAPRLIAEGRARNSGIWESMSGVFSRMSSMQSDKVRMPHLDFQNADEKIREMYSAKGLIELLQESQSFLSIQEIARFTELTTKLNDPEQWYKFVNESPAMKNFIEGKIAGWERQDYLDKTAYMQLIIVLFLTLSVTYSFMSNVQNFAARLSGAGLSPAEKMVNLYNMSVKRITASFKQ